MQQGWLDAQLRSMPSAYVLALAPIAVEDCENVHHSIGFIASTLLYPLFTQHTIIQFVKETISVLHVHFQNPWQLI